MTIQEAMTRAIKEAEAFCNGFEVAPYGKTFSDFREITTIQFFNKIYNDFKNKLEELNNRSCKGCKHFEEINDICNRGVFLNWKHEIDDDSFYCSRYEAKGE